MHRWVDSLQLGSVPSRNIEPPCGAVRAEAATHAFSRHPPPTSPPSQLPTLRSPTPSYPLPPSIAYTYIFTMPAYGPARLGVLISSTVPDTLFSLFHPPIYSTSLFLPRSRHGVSPPIFLFIFFTFLLPHPRFPVYIYIYTPLSLLQAHSTRFLPRLNAVANRSPWTRIIQR